MRVQVDMGVACWLEGGSALRQARAPQSPSLQHEVDFFFFKDGGSLTGSETARGVVSSSL